MHVQVPHVCELMCIRVYMHMYAWTVLTSDVFIGFSLPHPLRSGLSRTERWMIRASVARQLALREPLSQPSACWNYRHSDMRMLVLDI